MLLPTFMAFGIYIHIPYCLQRCHYCDFSTYEKSFLPPISDYVLLLLEEFRQKEKAFEKQKLTSIYFGGGTPSLLSSSLILSVLNEVSSSGFVITPNETEITIEINPASIDSSKLESYLKVGINRFSLGVQSFHDKHLKRLGRIHSVSDSLETLALLASFQVNYSLDLLFGLPDQSLNDLEVDLSIIDRFNPNHISPYYLTLSKEHFLNVNRPEEDIEIKMFQEIESFLTSKGFFRYEISNYSRPGFDSKHNLLYWTDQEYWGLGLSAHSYIHKKPWGLRFWNENSFEKYRHHIKINTNRRFSSPTESLESSLYEDLCLHEAMTDYCHTTLRTAQGLQETLFVKKFSVSGLKNLAPKLQKLKEQGLIYSIKREAEDAQWVLSSKGQLQSNSVFRELTFFEEDLRES